MRDRAVEIGRAAAALPQALATVFARLTEYRPQQPLILAGSFALMLLVGWLAELALRRATGSLRSRLELARAGSFVESE